MRSRNVPEPIASDTAPIPTAAPAARPGPDRAARCASRGPRPSESASAASAGGSAASAASAQPAVTARAAASTPASGMITRLVSSAPATLPVVETAQPRPGAQPAACTMKTTTWAKLVRGPRDDRGVGRGLHPDGPGRPLEDGGHRRRREPHRRPHRRREQLPRCRPAPAPAARVPDLRPPVPRLRASSHAPITIEVVRRSRRRTARRRGSPAPRPPGTRSPRRPGLSSRVRLASRRVSWSCHSAPGVVSVCPATGRCRVVDCVVVVTGRRIVPSWSRQLGGPGRCPRPRPRGTRARRRWRVLQPCYAKSPVGSGSLRPGGLGSQ